LKRLVLILVLLTGLGFSTDLYGQTGGRKREPKAKRRGNFHLTQWKSMGHADEFAKGNKGRKNFFTKYFKKDTPAWTYRSSGTPSSHYKDNRNLFYRDRTKGRSENAMTLDRQNVERSHSRSHGNREFKTRKFKRK
jgi:hypothetical protein